MALQRAGATDAIDFSESPDIVEELTGAVAPDAVIVPQTASSIPPPW